MSDPTDPQDLIDSLTVLTASYEGRRGPDAWSTLTLRAARDEIRRLRSEVTTLTADRDRLDDQATKLAEWNTNQARMLARVTALCDEMNGHGADSQRDEIQRLRQIIAKIHNSAVRAAVGTTQPEFKICRKQVGQLLCNDREGHDGYCSHIYSRVATPEETQPG